MILVSILKVKLYHNNICSYDINIRLLIHWEKDVLQKQIYIVYILFLYCNDLWITLSFWYCICNYLWKQSLQIIKIRTRSSLQQHYPPNCMWGLYYYSHVDNTCMISSCHYVGRFGCIALVLTPTPFIEVRVPSQLWHLEVMYIYIYVRVSILSRFLWLFDYIVKMFRQYGIFYFLFDIMKKYILST